MTFVLDASITVAWAFDDEAPQGASKLLARARDHGAVVPRIWPYEVANVLLTGERRNRLTTSAITFFLERLSAFPIEVDTDGQETLWGGVLSLAREQRLSVYDAAYLELAMRRGLALATGDQALQAAAQRVGVALA